MSRYQKSKTNLDFTEATDSEWQWHQLGHMQVCTHILHDFWTPTHRGGELPALPAGGATGTDRVGERLEVEWSGGQQAAPRRDAVVRPASAVVQMQLLTQVVQHKVLAAAELVAKPVLVDVRHLVHHPARPTANPPHVAAAHTRLPSVRFRSRSRFLAVSLQVT